MQGKRWSNEAELAALIKARAWARKSVVLSPDTALFVAIKMETAALKPTREEVARVFCDRRCEKVCYLCSGKANLITQKYGHSLPPRDRGGS